MALNYMLCSITKPGPFKRNFQNRSKVELFHKEPQLRNNELHAVCEFVFLLNATHIVRRKKKKPFR